jgi:hypothetical protein
VRAGKLIGAWGARQACNATARLLSGYCEATVHFRSAAKLSPPPAPNTPITPRSPPNRPAVAALQLADPGDESPSPWTTLPTFVGGCVGRLGYQAR